MTFQLKDRVRATTDTTGTGTYTIDAAATGFQGFDALTSGRQIAYCVVMDDDFEVGLGTITIGGTIVLTRDTILDSSAVGAINWGVGTKEIFVVSPAAMLMALEYSGGKRNGNFDGTMLVVQALVAAAGVNVLGSVAGTNSITGTLTPAITAYTVGLPIVFVPANTNTGAVTLAANGLTARSIVKGDGTALEAGDIISGVPALVIYDLANTRWSLVNPQVRVSSNVPLLDAANTWTAIQTITSAAPTLRWNETDVGVDGGVWQLDSFSGAWRLTSRTDALGVVYTPILAAHDGSSLAFAATAITLNGVNVTDYARKSVGGAFTASFGQSHATNPYVYLQETGGGGISYFQWVGDVTRIDAPSGSAIALYSHAGAHNVSLSSAGALTRDGHVVWDDTTDGAGSGLDADLLDGLQATAFLKVSNNLSDVASASTARGNLGLGSLSTQSASAVAITGGTITGITDLAVADGGTGASDAAGARTAFGIGSMATREVTISTSAPSGGADGDVWLKYTP